jgi:hypothetical protein
MVTAPMPSASAIATAAANARSAVTGNRDAFARFSAMSNPPP